mgnify:CR=1 FL=1
MSKKKSQISDIIDHLGKYKTITSMEAIEMYGATRLSGIIYILKERGFDIETELLEVKNRYGHVTRIAVYHLVKDITEQEVEEWY